MCLDLVVESCAKPGHEAEWRRILKRAFAEQELSPAETARFNDISIPGDQRIGAPRVGFDKAAEAWITQARQARTPEEVAGVLAEFHGYYVLRLAPCDGVPEYSNACCYDGTDETSFRGAFLKDCTDVLSKALRNDAWNSKFPEDAIAYGQALLAAADAAEKAGPAPKPRSTLLSRIGVMRPSTAQPVPLADQLAITRAAGRWFIFWGGRGHAIRAWF